MYIKPVGCVEGVLKYIQEAKN